MNNKKSIIALLIIAIVGIIGLTVAYFSNSTDIENQFKTKPYGSTVTEEFVSPDNWTPGTTTDKTVVTTNTGSVDEAVRISYTEKWVAADGTELSGWVDEDGNVTDHATELVNNEKAAIINFDNESDWTLNNGYYYYNYKLAPGEVTSSFIKSVTFNPIVQSSSDCSKTVTGGSQTIACTSTKEGYDGATYTLTFTIETVQYDQYAVAWNTSSIVTIASEKPATKILRDKANGLEVTNYIDGDTKEMYTFKHEETEQTGPLTDYRYIGNDPNNYVYFNCDNDGTNCEIWRIIGVFSVDDGTGNVEQRIKLIRGGEFSDNMVWDTKNIYGINDWTYAELNNFLNDTYYNRTGIAETYGLKESARNKIGDAKYYLGGKVDNLGSTDDIYTWERGTNVYNGHNIVWIGKVGLIYASDNYYTYAKGVDDVCYAEPQGCTDKQYKFNPLTDEDELIDKDNPGYPENGWIYISNIGDEKSDISSISWIISPYSDNPNYAFRIESGILSSGYPGGAIGETYGVRPVVYLTSDVQIDGGTGSSEDPYVLKK